MTNRLGDCLWVNLTRSVAIISVVLLHSATPILNQYNHVPLHSWWIGNIYDSSVRMCVPLFFMLTGHLLLEKDESLSVFFKKRITKVFFPLLVWSIFYVFWRKYYEGNDTITLRSFYSLLLAPSYEHLWFLYAIAGIYIYLPVMKIFVNNSNKKKLWYFVLLWFVAVALIPFTEKITRITSRIDFDMISGFGGYLVVGHLLGKINIQRRLIVCSIILAILSVSITAYGTFFLTKLNNGVLSVFFYNYLSPNVIVYSIAVFILLRSMPDNIPFFHKNMSVKVMTCLSSTSLGVYFIHPIYMSLLKNGAFGCKISSLIGNPIFSVPLTAILTFMLSFISVNILKKIVPKIVP